MKYETRQRDRGSILPMVLVITTVLGIVVAAVATYTTVDLRYGNVVEGRADRLAAADGGMRFAVEHVDAGLGQLCTTGTGHDFAPPTANDSSVAVSCGPAGVPIDDTNGWALILTGEGVPDASFCALELIHYYDGSGPQTEWVNPCSLMKTVAGTAVPKVINGPVYMADSRFDAFAELQFGEGYLVHGGDCSVAHFPETNVSFGPESLGSSCDPNPWSKAHLSVPWSATADATNGKFSEPFIPTTDLAALPLNPSTTSVSATGSAPFCTVFEPGYYTSLSVSAGGSYFKSGNYVLDGVNVNMTGGTHVTAGQSSGDAGDTLALSTNAHSGGVCEFARSLDTNTTPTTAGATFYLRNGSDFTIGPNSSFEVLRRKQGTSYVSIHYLDASQSWSDRVITHAPGTNKDMAIHGLIWAPRSGLQFGLVTNEAQGQLLGGAVLSNIDLRSSAVGNGLMVRIEPSDLHLKLRLDSVAEKNGKTTTIRSIVDYRPSTTYTAVTSWRVVD